MRAVVKLSQGVLTRDNSSKNGDGLKEDILVVLKEQMVVLEEQIIEWWEEYTKEIMKTLEVIDMMASI